jgi:hypothetical protein
MSRLPSQPNAQVNTGLSTKQKVALLAGAAALYYLYRKHQAKAQAQGYQIQYYRSRNGGVYYRDPQNPQKVTWVTPPSQPIQVPYDEGQQYSGYEGYNNQRTGRTVEQLFPVR